MYYFLSTENRQNHRQEFIAAYYNQFVATLKQLGYMKQPPSMMDLQVELLKNGILEVILSICNVILFYIGDSTPEDYDMGEGTRKAYKRLYNNPEYKAMIEKELPRFLYNGFIWVADFERSSIPQSIKFWRCAFLLDRNPKRFWISMSKLCQFQLSLDLLIAQLRLSSLPRFRFRKHLRAQLSNVRTTSTKIFDFSWVSITFDGLDLSEQ